jgi:hypothetical protein
MQFKIVGNNQHQAVHGGSAFTCILETTRTETGHLNRWSAFKNDRLLKTDCRTLNEAKKVCRAAAAENPVAVLNGVFPTPGAAG